MQYVEVLERQGRAAPEVPRARKSWSSKADVSLQPGTDHCDFNVIMAGSCLCQG